MFVSYILYFMKKESKNKLTWFGKKNNNRKLLSAKIK